MQNNYLVMQQSRDCCQQNLIAGASMAQFGFLSKVDMPTITAK